MYELQDLRNRKVQVRTKNYVRASELTREADQQSKKDMDMAHKFAVGQAVEYKPIGAKIGVFKIVKQMPEEFRAVDLKYRIKSVQETFERNVLECDLSRSIVPEEQYEPMRPLRHAGRHH